MSSCIPARGSWPGDLFGLVPIVSLMKSRALLLDLPGFVWMRVTGACYVLMAVLLQSETWAIVCFWFEQLSMDFETQINLRKLV